MDSSNALMKLTDCVHFHFCNSIMFPGVASVNEFYFACSVDFSSHDPADFISTIFNDFLENIPDIIHRERYVRETGTIDILGAALRQYSILKDF